VADLMIIVRILEEKGWHEGHEAAHRHELSRGPLASGMLSVFAELETNLRREHQMEPSAASRRSTQEAQARAHLQRSPADDPAGRGASS